jgi:TatD DNase family protein
MLTDLHCHLNELSEDDLSGVLERAKAAGVSQFMAIGAGYEFAANAKTLAIAEKYPQVYCALGMHPHDARLVTDDTIEQIRQMAKSPRVKAIGEIGLDYHYLHSPKEDQRRVLADFVRLAHELKKPLVIHDRDCGDELIDILRAEGAEKLGGMVHCFTGAEDLARKYLDLGFIVSFTGIITFKKSDALREVVKMVPLDRITVETDSPFLAPMPHRGKKNEPAYVRLVAEAVAAIKGVSVEELARVTHANIQRVFAFG